MIQEMPVAHPSSTPSGAAYVGAPGFPSENDGPNGFDVSQARSECAPGPYTREMTGLTSGDVYVRYVARSLNAFAKDASDLTSGQFALLYIAARSHLIKPDFDRLASRWKSETALLSNGNAIRMHDAYLEIIGLGPAAVPLILDALAEGDDSPWFWALHAITREDPATENDYGYVQKMSEAWLKWGAARGYRAGSARKMSRICQASSPANMSSQAHALASTTAFPTQLEMVPGGGTLPRTVTGHLTPQEVTNSNR